MFGFPGLEIESLRPQKRYLGLPEKTCASTETLKIRPKYDFKIWILMEKC